MTPTHSDSPSSDAEAVREACAGIAHNGSVAAFESMAESSDVERYAHSDVMDAVGKALAECESMIRSLPLHATRPETRVEKLRAEYLGACLAHDDAIAQLEQWRVAHGGANHMREDVVEKCRQMHVAAYRALFSAERAATGKEGS